MNRGYIGTVRMGLNGGCRTTRPKTNSAQNNSAQCKIQKKACTSAHMFMHACMHVCMYVCMYAVHNIVTPVRLQAAAPRSRVKHSTTVPPQIVLARVGGVPRTQLYYIYIYIYIPGCLMNCVKIYGKVQSSNY